MTGLLMILGFALLVGGADLLIRGGASVALRLGLTPLVVGLTVVAFGTSCPELVVSLRAALVGSGSIAVGNVVGSNICNIALILGLAALIRPLNVKLKLIRWDVPIMIGCSLVIGVLLLDGSIARGEGILLWAGIVAYVALSIHLAQREKRQLQAALLEAAPVPTHPSKALGLDLVMIAAGLGLLLFGADLFVKGAVTIARYLGVSEAVIGLTLVALGTSLPELATSAVAAFRGQADIAVGNVIGSNIFNILAILGVTATIHPLRWEGIGMLDLGVMAGLALLMLPLMRTGFRVSRLEGVFLLFVYAAYIIYIAA
jgi:cation:H+ antiporter